MRSSFLFLTRWSTPAIVAAPTLISVVSLEAAPFAYHPRDLLLGFRRTGGTFEMTVDLGSSSNYYNANPGSSWTITNYTVAQLRTAFGDFNSLKWSVSGNVRLPQFVVDGKVQNTLWVTRPRASLNVQTLPWVTESEDSQGTTAAQIESIGDAATRFSDSNPAGPENTVTAVVMPQGADSYGAFVGTGNFKGTFQGNVEKLTSSTFETGGVAVRSDLYELIPYVIGSGSSSSGRFLGYFEFRPDGTMIFQAAGGTPPEAPPRPTIQQITRVGTTSTISFTTTNDATVNYQLVYTNANGLTASVTNWPKLTGATITGNGSVRSLQDTTSDQLRFYSVTASR